MFDTTAHQRHRLIFYQQILEPDAFRIVRRQDGRQQRQTTAIPYKCWNLMPSVLYDERTVGSNVKQRRRRKKDEGRRTHNNSDDDDNDDNGSAKKVGRIRSFV